MRWRCRVRDGGEAAESQPLSNRGLPSLSPRLAEYNEVVDMCPEIDKDENTILRDIYEGRS